MKIASYIKLPDIGDVDNPILGTFANEIRRNHSNSIVKFLKKGRVSKGFTIRFGEDGEDFINNTITVITESRIYKAPRIFCKLKLKKYEKSGAHNRSVLSFMLKRMGKHRY